MSEHWAVRLKTGEWKDVVYVYGKIGLREHPDKDGATLQFNYKILDAGDHEEDDLTKDADFNNYIGDVLSHIMTDTLDQPDFTLGRHERTDANNGSTEPDPE